MELYSNVTEATTGHNGSLPSYDRKLVDALPVVWGIVFLIAVLLAFVGNALLIQRIQQTLQNTFIVSVTVSISCLSACIAIVIVLPTSLALLGVPWWSDRTLCTIQGLMSFAAMTGHGLTSLLSVVGIRFKLTSRAKKYFCTWWIVGIIIISGMLGSLPLLDDDVYVFEASLSMCTAPSPTIFTISCSIHVAVIIVVCTSIHRHLNPHYNEDVESGQHSSISDVAEGSDRTVFEAEEKLAHNVLLYTFVSSLLILVALAFAITSVMYQNKWFGLFCIFVMGIACVVQPSILFSRSASLRHTASAVAPQPDDVSSITQNILPNIDINKGIEVPLFRKRSFSTTLHFKSKVSDSDMRIRSISTTCTSSGTKFSKESKFHTTKCTDSLSSNKTRVSIKSSKSTQSKTSSISIHLSSGPDSKPSWTRYTVSSIETPISDSYFFSVKRYRNVEPTKIRRIVSEADMTKYMPSSYYM